MESRKQDPAIAPTYFLWNAFVPDRYYYEVLFCLPAFVKAVLSTSNGV